MSCTPFRNAILSDRSSQGLVDRSALSCSSCLIRSTRPSLYSARSQGQRFPPICGRTAFLKLFTVFANWRVRLCRVRASIREFRMFDSQVCLDEMIRFLIRLDIEIQIRERPEKVLTTLQSRVLIVCFQMISRQRARCKLSGCRGTDLAASANTIRLGEFDIQDFR